MNSICKKVILSVVLVMLCVALYITFGFFFDAWLESIPLLLPIGFVGLIVAKKELQSKAVIAVVVVFLVLSVAMASAVGAIATSNPGHSEKIEGGRVDVHTYSRQFMKDTYRIDQKTVVRVWLPDGYTTTKEYPVVYVLDGDGLFHYAAVQASRQAKAGKGECIVVGIGYGYWNYTFARGGLVWQDIKNVRGRWRDFYFADDTSPDFIPGKLLGDEYKRGKEFGEFLAKTVVADVRKQYAVSHTNSTLFGHSMGGGMAAYMFTQYQPQEGANNPFSNFVIVDNAFMGYYEKCFVQLANAMDAQAPTNPVQVYRIWGGAVNPTENDYQRSFHQQIVDENWANVHSYFYIPEGANHGDTQAIGLDAAIALTLGLPIENN